MILSELNIFTFISKRAAFLAVALLCSPLAQAQQGPSNLNVSGSLFNADGSVVASASVNFKIEIYDKAGTCLLYSENHLGQDLSGTRGGFSLEVGKGSSINNAIDSTSPTAITSKVFENRGVIAGGWAGCPSGATLAAGDNRTIRVHYDLGGGYVAMNPDVPIQAAAYSIVAETLQGKRPSDFIQVHDDVTNDLTQANVENVFSSTNYPKLTALLSGGSTDYISANPSAAVGLNNQRLTNVADPTSAQDAATKNYVDNNLGGKSVDVSGVGPATGDGYTLIWDQTTQTWIAGTPSATDNTKLPLAGGTMTGAIDMGGFNLLATGHITMSPLKTLTLGTFTTAQETTLVGTLTAANAGASWYNSTTNTFKIWDGSAAISQTFSGAAAGGDLTGTYPNPTIANDKITSAKVDSAGVGLNRLVISDQTTGATLKFATCATNEVLRYEGVNGWTCRDPSSIVTFPVDSVNGKTGTVVLNANDLGLGTAALENVGTGAGDIPQLDAGGKIPSSMIPAASSPTWGDITNGAGKYMTYKPNNTACGNNEILKFDGTNWICTTVSALGAGSGDFMKDGSVAMTGNFNAGGNSVVGNTTASANLTLESTSNATKGFVNIQPNGGNVGIGTTAPSAGLDVRSTLTGSTGTEYGAVIQPTANQSGTAGYTGLLVNVNTSATGSGTKTLLDAQLNGASKFSIGIGGGYVSSGLNWNHVSSAAVYSPTSSSVSFPSGTSARFNNTSVTAGTYSGLTMSTGNSTDYGYIGVVHPASGFTPSIVIGASTGANAYNEWMRFDTSGNVGIGTDSPARLLHVNGAARLTPTTTPASAAAGDLFFDSAASNALKYYDGSAWKTVGTGTGSGDFMKDGSVAMTGNFNAGGNSILGNTTSGANLTLESTLDATKGNIYLQPNGGNVGIGTTNPTGKLDVRDARTDTSGSPSTIAYGLGVNPASDSTANFTTATNYLSATGASNITGVAASLNVVASDNTATIANASGLNNVVQNWSTGTMSNANALVNSVTNYSTGTIAQTWGNYSTVNNAGAGTITGANGTRGYLLNSGSGTFGNGYAMVGLVENTGTGTINTAYGMYAGINRISGTITNGYGIYVDNVQATNKWSVYANDTTAPSYFAGSVGIGTNSPARALHVNGPVRITPAALPGTPAAGDLAFDSGASNSLKFYDGSAWQTVGTGTGNGDFKKDGSVAMTGNFNAGGNSILGNTSASANLTLESTSNATKGYVLIQPNGGRVGIGTATPAGVLDVVGAANSAASINLAAGSINTATAAGSVNITGGANTYGISSVAALAGDVNLTGGNGGAHGTGGNINLTGGTGNTGGSGAVNIKGANNGNAGGAVTIAGGTSSFAGGGGVTINGGNGNGVGGNISITGGTVGNGAGGSVTIAGGASSANGVGSSVSLSAGAASSGNGGNINITASNGAGTNVNGGNVVFTAGNKTGTGTQGAFQFLNGSVGIGTATPGRNLEIVSTGTATMGLVAASGTGGRDYLVGSTDSSSGAGSGKFVIRDNTAGVFRMTIDSSGNIGIGTTAPARLLHVNGPMRITPAALPTSPAAGELAFDSGSANALKYYDGSAWQTVGTGTGTGDFMKDGSVAMTGNLNAGGNSVLGNTTASANLTLESTSNATKGKVLIQPNGGNVGVGTTNPLWALDVNGGVHSSARFIGVGLTGVATSAFAPLVTQNTGASTDEKYWDIYHTATALSIRAVDDSYASSNTALQINRSGYTISSTVFPNGNVGIGTTSPIFKLDVVGNISASTTMTAGWGNASAPSYSIGGQSGIFQPATQTLGFTTSNTERMRISSSGNVGIGTATPGQMLSVAGVIESTSGGIKFPDGTTQTTAYDPAISYGYSSDLTSGKTVTGTFTFTGSGAGGNAALIDDLATPAADPVGANVSQYFQIDFGAGNAKHIRRLTAKTSSTGGYASAITYDFKYSDDNSTWTTVGSFTIPAGSGVLHTFDFTASAAHRYWKAVYNSGSTGGNTWLEEIEMMELTGTSQLWAANGTNAYYSSGNVGIGTSSPGDKLTVYSSSSQKIQMGALSGATTPADYASGGAYIAFSRPSDGTLSQGIFSYDTTSSAKNNLGISARSDIVFLAGAGGFTSNTERMRIDTNGNVGINTAAPATTLDVNGTIRSTAQTVPTSGSGTELLFGAGNGYVQAYNRTSSSWLPLTVQGSTVTINNNSDIRLKEKVQDIDFEFGLDSILKLRPVTYHWKDAEADKKMGQQFGLIAQETQKVYPHLVNPMGNTSITYADGSKEEVKNILGINYNGLIIPLLKGLQDLYAKWFADSEELHREIASVKAKAENLEKENAELKARLDQQAKDIELIKKSLNK